MRPLEVPAGGAAEGDTMLGVCKSGYHLRDTEVTQVWSWITLHLAKTLILNKSLSVWKCKGFLSVTFLPTVYTHGCV